MVKMVHFLLENTDSSSANGNVYVTNDDEYNGLQKLKG